MTITTRLKRAFASCAVCGSNMRPVIILRTKLVVALAFMRALCALSWFAVVLSRIVFQTCKAINNLECDQKFGVVDMISWFDVDTIMLES